MKASLQVRTSCVLSAAVLSGLCLMSFCATAQAEPRERDVYYGFLADGQRYGFRHVTVSRLPEGNFRYVVEERVLLDILGAQRQEIAGRTELVLTPDYAPVSVQAETTSPAGKLTAAGRVEQDKLHVELKRGTFEAIRTVDLAGTVVFHACLPDWLNEPARQECPSRRTFRVVDENSFTAWKASAEPKKTADGSAVWNVDLGPEIGRGEMAFDPDGVLQTVRMRIPPVHVERCSQQDSRAIRHRVMAGREVLSFPLTKPIPRPDRLTSLTVRLCWAGVARDQLKLEDERQHVADASEKNGKYRVVLNIRPIRPVKPSLKAPIEGAEFAPYLAETQFIKPFDEAIRAKAREWTQGKQTGLEAVRALSKAIAEYLQGGSLIAETLSGPEVLQCKQGKCSEHATLLASLARSLGIPTRIVLGLRLVGDRWIGHMWNEVYVGRWITVDTTVNEVGDSMQLVKLVHSDTVFGTQPVRWALTESLEVAVEGFQVAAGLVDGRYRTGVEGRVYTNVAYGCRLTAPSDDWSIEDKTKTGPTVVRFKVPDAEVLIHFVAFPLPEIFGPIVIVNARKLRFKSLYKEYKILEDGPYKSESVSGRIFVFQRAAMGKEPGAMKTTEVLWRSGGSCFLLNLIAEKSAHDEYLPKFTALVNSFEALGGPSP